MLLRFYPIAKPMPNAPGEFPATTQLGESDSFENLGAATET